MIPNIFKYATKELSQDAVVCWLVACARAAPEELHIIGLAFVQALMRSGNGMVIDVTDRQSRSYEQAFKVGQVLCEPEQQHGNIDVYFQAKVDGQIVSFIIENKRHTEMRGGQLERYLREVMKDSEPKDLIKAVYLKTGYVFDDEREKAESIGYSVFDIEDMVAFLDGDPRVRVHEILRQYAEYMETERSYMRNALAEWNLDKSLVQWEFMVSLGKVLQLSGKKWPARGSNRDGGAWTQYPHWEVRGEFFWRLDSGKSLRLMVDTSHAGDQALARWDGWYRAFEDARNESGLCAAKFRPVKKNSRGSVVNEGSIGAVDISGCLREEGLDTCIAKVANLHRMFIASVGDELSQ